jgi:hypothetical protein
MIAGVPGFAAARLGGNPKLAFLPVCFEGHGASIRVAWDRSSAKMPRKKPMQYPGKTFGAYIASPNTGD